MPPKTGRGRKSIAGPRKSTAAAAAATTAAATDDGAAAAAGPSTAPAATTTTPAARGRKPAGVTKGKRPAKAPRTSNVERMFALLDRLQNQASDRIL